MAASFAELNFILFDVQTTGTNPETSSILEVGWGLYRAALDPLTVDWHIRLLALAESTVLPRRIQKLTGLAPENWKNEPVVSLADWVAIFQDFLKTHDGVPILVHYARFKQPFLVKALGDLSQHRVICSYELARYAMPHLKSFSLRAVAGYAGFSLGDKKRSRDHLTATAFIWHHLVNRANAAANLPIHSADMRSKRLQLPDQPGVYFFLDQSGRILYVGKASSLKARLNSYFRGRKTKGSRLNEMLTRAVDFQTVVVGSELEALIRENEEIKRHNPPYNRALKADDRQIRVLSWGDQVWGPILWWPRLLPDENRETLRALALDLWQKSLERTPDDDAEEEAEADEDEEWENMLVHFIRHLHRARWYRRLVECEILWDMPHGSSYHLSIRAGVLQMTAATAAVESPPRYGTSFAERLRCIDLVTYDRLAILYNELRRGIRRGDRIRLHLRPGLVLDQDALRPLLLIPSDVPFQIEKAGD